MPLNFGQPLPEWIRLESARDTQRQRELSTRLDAGKSSAIALALEKPGSLIILDDYKARQDRLGVR